MLEIKNLSIQVKERYLVKDLSFHLNQNDKVAIIGEEGNGKSTLLKSILGINDYAIVSGSINKKGKIGYLKQSFTTSELQKKVVDYLFSTPYEYYERISKLYKYLDRIHLSKRVLEQEIHTLSGGEKVKVGILKLLLGEYDIYFLDEPTNDLDIESLEWLEAFINHEEKPIIYVSHDEELLEHTANAIIHLEQIKKKTECRSTFLRLDYKTYILERLRHIDKQNKIAKNEKREYAKQQEKLNQLMNKVQFQQNTISRSDPHGARLLKKKMQSIKAQEKRFNQVKLTEEIDTEDKIHFFFPEVFVPKNKMILNLDLPLLKIDEKVLSKNIHLEVFGNEHVTILGANGVGKSTFIKIIYEHLKNRSDITLGYMPQNYEEILGDYTYVLDYLVPDKNPEKILLARTLLGNLKFIKEEVEGNIQDLSNGEKAKLILAYFVLNSCNVLLLDEPTRNVSPLSNPVIRDALKKFNGTIISVSHDRKYIFEVSSKTYLLTEEGLFFKNID